jgi:dethiobiotin synthetase
VNIKLTHSSNNLSSLFITGIGTGVGKTLISALLVKALNAYYWKPIQSGVDPSTDTNEVMNLTRLPPSHFLKERFTLHAPLSPHASASLEGRHLSVSDFSLPLETPLIVEGAGGILVPINDQETILDLIRYLRLPVLVVSHYYLGSINHTLLTLRVLAHEGINVLGIITSGDKVLSSEEAIKCRTSVPILYHVPFLPNDGSQEAVREFEWHAKALSEVLRL